jgi:hypothetical protein
MKPSPPQPPTDQMPAPTSGPTVSAPPETRAAPPETPPPTIDVKPAAAPKVAAPPAPKSSISNRTKNMPPPSPPPPSSGTPKPELDFKSLVQRLRDTSAVGVFTKLSIKNQVDDLLKAFRGYYAGQVPPSLDELRQRYDGLLLKVVTLVQDGDASLAASISASRGAIWEKLSNRETFQAL